MEFERKRRDEKMAAGYPGTEGFTVDELTPGEEIDASIAGMPATGFRRRSLVLVVSRSTDPGDRHG